MKKIRRRKLLYIAEGGVHMDGWKLGKNRTNDLVWERKQGYLEMQNGHILAEDANPNFFHHVHNFSTHKRPKLFDVHDILPGREDNNVVADELADYFN